MVKVKVVEVIPHINLKTGKKLGEPEKNEEIKDILKATIFGKRRLKIKIKPGITAGCVEIYGVGAPVVKMQKNDKKNMFVNEEPIILNMGQKIKITFQALDYVGHFEVENLEI